MAPDYETWTTANTYFEPTHTLRDIQRSVDELRRMQMDSMRMASRRMYADWGPEPPRFEEATDKTPKDCGHKKLNSKYYNQLVDYYCQLDGEVKKMRDVDGMKNCCILAKVKK